MKTLRLGALALIGSIGLAACDPVPPPPPPPVDGRVVFSSESVVGFGGFPLNFNNPSGVTVFGDGRVVVYPQARTAMYPQPALLIPQQFKVSADGVQFVRQLAQQAGLGTARTLSGGSCVADAGSNWYSLDGLLTTVVAPSAECPQMTAEERDARSALRRLDDAMFRASTTLASYIIEAARPIPFDRMAIAWQVITPAQIPDLATVSPWPTSLVPLGQASPRAALNGFCEVRSGLPEAIGTLLLAAQSTDISVFTQGDSHYRVFFRPMLPSETTCVSLVTGSTL